MTATAAVWLEGAREGRRLRKPPHEGKERNANGLPNGNCGRGKWDEARSSGKGRWREILIALGIPEKVLDGKHSRARSAAAVKIVSDLRTEKRTVIIFAQCGPGRGSLLQKFHGWTSGASGR